jgi:hypothetical protein
VGNVLGVTDGRLLQRGLSVPPISHRGTTLLTMLTGVGSAALNAATIVPPTARKRL